jgi:hypothetical protein
MSGAKVCRRDPGADKPPVPRTRERCRCAAAAAGRPPRLRRFTCLLYDVLDRRGIPARKGAFLFQALGGSRGLRPALHEGRYRPGQVSELPGRRDGGETRRRLRRCRLRVCGRGIDPDQPGAGIPGPRRQDTPVGPARASGRMLPQSKALALTSGRPLGQDGGLDPVHRDPRQEKPVQHVDGPNLMRAAVSSTA